MTGSQMLYEWRLGFDVIASGAAPGFTNTQVYAILNRAQDDIILELVNSKEYTKLIPLVTGATLPLVGISDKLCWINVPSDYWLYLNSYSTLNRVSLGNSASGFIPEYTVDSGELFRNELINPEQAVNYKPSSFNNYRLFKEPKTYIEGNRLYTIMDDFMTISEITLQYVRKRADVSDSVSCELPEVTHRFIVNRAIDIAKLIINSQNQQNN